MRQAGDGGFGDLAGLCVGGQQGVQCIGGGVGQRGQGVFDQRGDRQEASAALKKG